MRCCKTECGFSHFNTVRAVWWPNGLHLQATSYTICILPNPQVTDFLHESPCGQHPAALIHHMLWIGQYANKVQYWKEYMDAAICKESGKAKRSPILQSILHKYDEQRFTVFARRTDTCLVVPLKGVCCTSQRKIRYAQISFGRK